ncbi:MAG: diguanylate cyclase [Legionellaceae bacterium]|nr:diguanylate cyclase [Legionellaceae bacterium]
MELILKHLIYDRSNRRSRVLIVDDQPASIKLLNGFFAEEYEVFMATSGKQALEICEKSLPDIILLDVVMPDMDGLQLCMLLRKNTKTKDIPVIFITSLQSTDDETACWEAGGVDFVNKPINPTTLRNRIKSHLTLKFQSEYLKKLALSDALTMIANRRCFDERLDLDFRRAKRNNQSMALLLIDVDNFKTFNDEYGHQTGDECLRKIASTLTSSLNRPADLAARYGGEEFVCLLPETEERGAYFIAEKILKKVRELRINTLTKEVVNSPTVSIGVAIYPSLGLTSIESFIKEADARLYLAKKHGRNCIILP